MPALEIEYDTNIDRIDNDEFRRNLFRTAGRFRFVRGSWVASDGHSVNYNVISVGFGPF